MITGLIIFVFVAAVTVCILHTRWMAWAVFALCVFIAYSVLAWGLYLPAEQAFVSLVGAAFLGFLAPELWEALRTTVRRPRNAAIVLAIAATVLLLWLKPAILSDLLYLLMVLILIVVGYGLFLRPIFKGKPAKKS